MIARLTGRVERAVKIGFLYVAAMGLAVFADAQQTPVSPVPVPVPVPGAVTPGRVPISGQQYDGGQTYVGGELGEGVSVSGAGEAPSGFGVRAQERPTVRTIKSGGAGARAGGQRSPYEPVLNNPVPFVELPTGGQRVSFSASAGPLALRELLDMVALATDWNIAATEEAEKMQVRIWVNEVEARMALEILQRQGIFYEWDEENKLLTVMTQEEYLQSQYGGLKRQEFSVQYADVTDMESILTSLLSPIGRIVVDPRTGNVIVWDTDDNLTEMERVTKSLDQPLEPRIFHLDYIDTDSILDSVETVLSERGIAHADPRSNTVIVTDLPTRLEQIANVIEALDAQVETRTWTLDYVDEEAISERLEFIVPEEMGGISYDEKTHQISVTAIPTRLQEVDELIEAWDVKPKQVHIKAFIVSAGTDLTRNFGINWAYFDELNGTPFSLQRGTVSADFLNNELTGERFRIGQFPNAVPEYFPGTTTPMTDLEGNTIIDHFRGDDVAVMLEYLHQTKELQILSRPAVTVRDGETAVFEDTEDQPYQEGGYSTRAGSDYIIPLRVQFLQVGTILEVTPRINEDNNVLMEIRAESSQPGKAAQSKITGEIPGKKQSAAETLVMAKTGQTIIIGGLQSTSSNDNIDKVPLLGDLPLVGKLFKTTNRTRKDGELMIFLTPTIVDEYTHPETERLARYDEEVADTLRQSKKPLMGRIENRLTHGRNEIGVSIGQGGAMYSEGKVVTIDGLRERFFALENPGGVTAVIRVHPRAPRALSTNVAEVAMEAGLEVDFDDTVVPFVPARREQPEEGAAETEVGNGAAQDD